MTPPATYRPRPDRLRSPDEIELATPLDASPRLHLGTVGDCYAEDTRQWVPRPGGGYRLTDAPCRDA